MSLLLTILALTLVSSCAVYDAIFGAAEEVREGAKATKETVQAVRNFVIEDLIPWAVGLLAVLGWVMRNKLMGMAGAALDKVRRKPREKK